MLQWFWYHKKSVQIGQTEPSYEAVTVTSPRVLDTSTVASGAQIGPALEISNVHVPVGTKDWPVHVSLAIEMQLDVSVSVNESVPVLVPAVVFVIVMVAKQPIYVPRAGAGGEAVIVTVSVTELELVDRVR